MQNGGVYNVDRFHKTLQYFKLAAASVTHSKHHLPAPSSKLCQTCLLS